MPIAIAARAGIHKGEVNTTAKSTNMSRNMPRMNLLVLLRMSPAPNQARVKLFMLRDCGAQ